LLFNCFLFYANAQNRLSDHNTLGWLTTTITPTINKKFSGHIEYQFRRDNIVTDWQQSLFRVGINYKVHPQVTLHAGYGWIETFPYGDYNLSSMPRRFPEHRIYEQLVVTSPVGKSNLMHRLRLEQRWIGRFNSMNSPNAEQFVYLNRLRYMPRLDVPISKKWYASVYDEIFIGFGKNVGENVFDQNRVGVLAGYKLNKKVKLEAGLFNQTVQLGREINNQNVFQYNNGIIINTVFNL
jgi:hypothetical protein